MDTLEILSGLFYLITFLAVLVIIGFLITWIVGKASKNKTTKKVGRRGSAITGIVLVVALLLAGIKPVTTK
ncbi:hypothetical protein [Limosilactobacillus antri]|uniref:hypothetical protein n=1 Tax=Limosilactobacillus antri TaxID=227943 RepID=UPI001F56ECAD|nr:hypothetical protein [Limosilactobacillus antri]